MTPILVFASLFFDTHLTLVFPTLLALVLALLARPAAAFDLAKFIAHIFPTSMVKAIFPGPSSGVLQSSPLVAMVPTMPLTPTTMRSGVYHSST